jgi:hypothetical protein
MAAKATMAKGDFVPDLPIGWRRWRRHWQCHFAAETLLLLQLRKADFVTFTAFVVNGYPFTVDSPM